MTNEILLDTDDPDKKMGIATRNGAICFVQVETQSETNTVGNVETTTTTTTKTFGTSWSPND